MFIPSKKRSGSLKSCTLSVRKCYESGTCSTVLVKGRVHNFF